MLTFVFRKNNVEMSSAGVYIYLNKKSFSMAD